MRLDRRVDMRPIRQISQKMGKLWSPAATRLSTVELLVSRQSRPGALQHSRAFYRIKIGQFLRE